MSMAYDTNKNKQSEKELPSSPCSGEDDNGASRQSGDFLVMSIIFVVLAVVPSIVIYRVGILGVFNFFCQDTFYYLTVARNSTIGFYTFDGQLPTNGFHPMWQAMLTGFFNLLGRSDQVTQIYCCFFWSALCATMGYVLSGLAIFRITGSRLLGALIIPGLYYFLFPMLGLRIFSPFGTMNGMESGLTTLFGGSLFCLFAVGFEAPRKHFRHMYFYVLVGINMAFIVLVRVDDLFLTLSFCLCFLVLRKWSIWNLKTVTCLALPSVVVLLVYICFNFISAGTLIPISGLSKAGFSLYQNIEILAGLMAPKAFPADRYYSGLVLHHLRIHILIWAPALLSILGILWIHTRLRRPPKWEVDESRLFLVALLSYVCMKAVYNLTNVYSGHQGYWYYTFSIMVVNFVALIIISSISSTNIIKPRILKMAGVLVLTVFLTFHFIFIMKKMMWPKNRVYDFWNQRSRIACELLNRQPEPKLLELDDGFISYSLEVPAIHGLGFVIDHKGYLALQRGELLKYCYGRGYDVIASMQYLPRLEADSSPADIRLALKHAYIMEDQSLSGFHFRMLFFDQATKTSFIKFWPKESK